MTWIESSEFGLPNVPVEQMQVTYATQLRSFGSPLQQGC
jgi:hypothetical protein